MKKSLLLLLGVLTLCVSACDFSLQGNNGFSSSTKSDSSLSSIEEQAEKLDLKTLLQKDETTNKWLYENQKVTVEHMAVAGRYGKTLYGVQGFEKDGLVTDVLSLEIECAALPNFTTDGFGADITATGRVVVEEDHLVLKNANTSINSEKPDGGLTVYFYTENAVHHSNWNTFFSNPIFHGLLLECSFTIKEIPQTITSNSPEMNFVVTFLENISVNVLVPKGSDLCQSARDKFNSFFESKKQGDHIWLDGLIEYSKNGGFTLLIEDYWCQRLTIDTKEYHYGWDWQYIKDEYSTRFFNNCFVDLSGMDEKNIYCFTTYFTSGLKDASWDPKGLFSRLNIEMSLNCSSEIFVNDLETTVLDQGFQYDGSNYYNHYRYIHYLEVIGIKMIDMKLELFVYTDSVRIQFTSYSKEGNDSLLATDKNGIFLTKYNGF